MHPRVAKCSVSNNEAVETSSLGILVAHETVAGIRHCLSLNIKDGSEVLEHLHLIAVVMGVVLDVILVDSEVFHNVLLLPQLYEVRNGR